MILTMLRQHPLFHGFSEAQHDALLAAMRPCEAEAGAWLWGGPPSETGLLPRSGAMVALIEGSIALRRQGSAPMTACVHAGEIFGEVHVLRDLPVCEARAVTPCRMQHIDRAGFQRFLQFAPGSTFALIEALGLQIAQERGILAEGRFLGPYARLARMLTRAAVADRSGRLMVRTTQKELGEKIGLSRESTNRQLQGWVRKSWIAVHKGKVEILQAHRLLAAGRQI